MKRKKKKHPKIKNLKLGKFDIFPKGREDFHLVIDTKWGLEDGFCSLFQEVILFFCV